MKTRFLLLFFLITFIFFSCTRYNDTVTPIKLPDSSSNYITFANGLKVTAYIVNNEEAGFNINSAKVLPVKLTIVNNSKYSAIIAGSQTFLIDKDNNAWPILSYKKALNRIKNSTEIGDTISGSAKPSLLGGLLGAVGGLAIGILTDKDVAESAGKGAAVGAAAGAVVGGISSYQNNGEEIEEDISNKHIRDKQILPDMITYGYLYFPGECKNPVKLRLAIEINGRLEVRTLNCLIKSNNNTKLYPAIWMVKCSLSVSIIKKWDFTIKLSI